MHNFGAHGMRCHLHGDSTVGIPTRQKHARLPIVPHGNSRVSSTTKKNVWKPDLSSLVPFRGLHTDDPVGNYEMRRNRALYGCPRRLARIVLPRIGSSLIRLKRLRSSITEHLRELCLWGNVATTQPFGAARASSTAPLVRLPEVPRILALHFRVADRNQHVG